MPDEKQKKFQVKRLNRILGMLLHEMKDLPDDGRDFPIRWNIMHMYSTSQLAKLLAMHRGIEPELAGIAAALHDIGIVKTKNTKGMLKQAKNMSMSLWKNITLNRDETSARYERRT
jgi:uncharacterized protein